MARYEIVSGPSKWELMIAFFHNEKPSNREDVHLRAVDKWGKDFAFQIKINSLTEENWESQIWGFTGKVVYICWEAEKPNTPCKGSFSTRSRKGWIEF